MSIARDASVISRRLTLRWHVLTPPDRPVDTPVLTVTPVLGGVSTVSGGVSTC